MTILEYVILVLVSSAIGGVIGVLATRNWRWIHRRETDIWKWIPEEFDWLKQDVINPGFRRELPWQQFVPEPLRRLWFAFPEETRVVCVMVAHVLADEKAKQQGKQLGDGLVVKGGE